jgi:hypothetical protein
VVEPHTWQFFLEVCQRLPGGKTKIRGPKRCPRRAGSLDGPRCPIGAGRITSAPRPKRASRWRSARAFGRGSSARPAHPQTDRHQPTRFGGFSAARASRSHSSASRIQEALCSGFRALTASCRQLSACPRKSSGSLTSKPDTPGSARPVLHPICSSSHPPQCSKCPKGGLVAEVVTIRTVA